jgi:hypothetical protein
LSAHRSNETPQELQKKKTTLCEIRCKQKAEPTQENIDDKNTDNNDMPAVPSQPQNKRCVGKIGFDSFKFFVSVQKLSQSTFQSMLA